MNKIVFTKCPIETNRDEVFNMAKDDIELVMAIKSKAEELISNGIEVFAGKGNIIATENGYYFAFYEKDLKK